MKTSETFRVGIAQIAPVLGSVSVNLATHLKLLKKAAAQHLDLLVFPELSLTGYFLRDLVPDVAIHLPAKDGFDGSPELHDLLEETSKVDALVGVVLEDSRHNFYNASLYLSRGKILHIHRKVYLPTYGIFDEARFFKPGNLLRTFPVQGRNFNEMSYTAGTLICEDLWHPSSVGVLARQGLDLLLVQSASPGRGIAVKGGHLGTELNYAKMLSVYAELYSTYIVFVNRVGGEEGMLFWGGSRIIGPSGEEATPPASDSEAFLVYSLDPYAVRRARIQNPLLRDERTDVVDHENAYGNSLPSPN